MKMVGIIGSGTMGSGIAQVAATAGSKVLLFDNQSESLKNAENGLNKILDRLIEKGKIDQEKKNSIIGNITFSENLNDFNECTLVIEAITENKEVKSLVYSKLEEIVNENCIIASNTSSLSISELASTLNKPDRFIGIHFFNPPALMKLVEIIPAVQSSDAVLSSSKETIESWGKLTVIAKDTPGFIVNKVARPFYSESIKIYEEGMANIATIDWALKEIGGFRMGPFELMDYIGNDVNYAVTKSVYESFFYDSRYKPSFTQKNLVVAGYLGRKSGRGYYDYSDSANSNTFEVDQDLGHQIVERVVAMLINEAADTLQLNIASKEDIDLAMTAGVNYPKGLFKWADEIGISKCVEILDRLFDEYHEERYRCSILLRKMSKSLTTFYKNDTVEA